MGTRYKVTYLYELSVEVNSDDYDDLPEDKEEARERIEELEYEQHDELLPGEIQEGNGSVSVRVEEIK